MPRYDYGCGSCGIFEADASRYDSTMPCPICHKTARRRPFSGVPHLKGETVAKSIPDPQYRHEAEKRDLRSQGWDLDRSIRQIRKGIRETETGRVFDPQQAANAS